MASCQCSEISKLKSDESSLSSLLTRLEEIKESSATKIGQYSHIIDYFDSSGGDQAFHLVTPGDLHTNYEASEQKLPDQYDASIANIQAQKTTLAGKISTLESEDEEYHRQEEEE